MNNQLFLKSVEADIEALKNNLIGFIYLSLEKRNGRVELKGELPIVIVPTKGKEEEGELSWFEITTVLFDESNNVIIENNQWVSEEFPKTIQSLSILSLEDLIRLACCIDES